MHILALLWFFTVFALACWVMRATLAGRGEQMVAALLGRSPAPVRDIDDIWLQPDNDPAGAEILAIARPFLVHRPVRPVMAEPLPLAA
jgi:hypothetical protein